MSLAIQISRPHSELALRRQQSLEVFQHRIERGPWETFFQATLLSQQSVDILGHLVRMAHSALL
jgi:hypothetical protein